MEKQVEWKDIILLEHAVHNLMFGKQTVKLHKWQLIHAKIQDYSNAKMISTVVEGQIEIKANVIWMESVLILIEMAKKIYMALEITLPLILEGPSLLKLSSLLTMVNKLVI